MAQAPQGAPRQNRTVKDFKGMHTQNERVAIPEGNFAWLENVQPIGQGNLHSIPGRSLSTTFIPPTPTPPVNCPDEVPQPLQNSPPVFDILCCYNVIAATGFDAGSMYYVAPDESFWCTGSLFS